MMSKTESKSESKAERWYYESQGDFISDEKKHNDRNIWKYNYNLQPVSNVVASNKQKNIEKILQSIFGGKKLFHGIEEDEKKLYLHYLISYISPNTVSFEPSSFLQCIETKQNYFFTLVLFCKKTNFNKNKLIKYLCTEDYYTKIPIQKKKEKTNWSYPIQI